MATMARRVMVALALIVVLASAVDARKDRRTFRMKLWKKYGSGECEVLQAGYGQIHRGVKDNSRVIMKRYPAAVEEEHHVVEEFGEMIELYGRHAGVVEAFAFQETGCTRLVDAEPVAAPLAADDVRQLVNSGPSSNRIDIVFMGDGYTAAERDLHFADMQRLTDDMFSSTTFNAHLPLFNIWALYRESAESGIGVGGRPRDTAFGLYRDGTELRGVYCSKPTQALAACNGFGGADACDFPSLIGNDEFYGGLGGTFTISTSSHTSGTIVLRHELGHNLIDVGEEYDGGSAYFGANFASSVNNLGWKHWLTEPGRLVAEQSTLLAQAYPWHDLAKGKYTVNFSSTGEYARWLLKFSASGVETPGSLIVKLDGVELPWNTTGLLDRGFHELFGANGFARGAHTLTFEQGFPSETGQIRQLCNLVLHEFKNETEYHFEREYIGAYPTWRQGGALAGYRPNHEKCLMRNMTSVDFCVVCVEDMWLQLLEKISLIDDVVVEEGSANVDVALKLIPLAQLREDGAREGEEYRVTWTQNGSTRADLADRLEWSLPLQQARGEWTVTVQYINPDIRSDPRGYTVDDDEFEI